MQLPLKVVSFERYMLTDDRPSHPMTFTIRLVFSGRFDRQAFERAVRAAVDRHPLLGAHIAGQGSKLEWVAAPDSMPAIDYGEESKAFEFSGREGIDLRSETGLRIWVRTGDERVEMRIQFHHACCDGIGSYRFVEDLLCAYSLEVHPEAPGTAFRPLLPEQLARRTYFGLPWWRVLLRMPLEIWGVVVGLLQFFVLRPTPIASPHQPAEDDSHRKQLPNYPAYAFDEAESKHLRELARSLKCTLNDLLLRDIILGLDAWNLRHDPRARGELIRIMLPMNLRSPEDETLPAANVVAMVPVDRKMNWYRNRRLLLATLRLETTLFKVLGLAVSFIRCCKIVGAIPGGMEFLASAGRCYATSVFSNMGRLFADARLPTRDSRLIVGEMVLERVESAPPVRPFVSASMSALSYAGKLMLVMSYDRQRLMEEDAGALLLEIVEQVRQTLRRGQETVKTVPQAKRPTPSSV